MTDLIEEMQRYYERRAPIYDHSMGYDDVERVAALKPVTDLVSEAFASRTVLEIACGPGFWTGWYGGVARGVVATDFNATMLREARRKKALARGVSLLAADAYALPFGGRPFDAALAGDWLAHVPMKRMADFLDGLHATLLPGSRVVFIDQSPGSHSIQAFDDEGNHVQTRSLPDGSTYRVIKHFLSDTEIESVVGAYARGRVVISRFPEIRRVVVSYETT